MTITKNIAAKAAVAFVAVAMAFTLVAPAAKAQDVSSMSLEQLVALVNSLQGQLSGSATVSGSCSFTFTRSLSQGSSGADVMNLQKFLNMSADTQVAAAGSAGGPGMETSFFGPATAAAVSKFQTKYSADILVPAGLTSPTGYFGPASMAKANALCAAGAGTGTGTGTGSTGGLEGGAGTLDEAQFSGSFNNEEVGENQEDVEVVGWEIVPENSDIEITAVDVDFDKSNTGNSNFTKYADEVSIWLDGEEIARVDADEFSRSNEYSKTISIDEGAIIRDGETGELVIAVSGVSNVDSDDAGDSWDVGIASIRYQDAQGAYITDSSTDDLGDNDDDSTATDSKERAFTFEDFATASDMDFQVRSGDTSINTARTIEVSSTSKTSDVAILNFTVEVEGDSDMTLDELTVDATTTTADLDAVVATAYLYMDGERVGSETMTSAFGDADEITFNGLDLSLEAGETYEFEVRVDLNKADGSNYATGETITADVASADVDSTSKWVVEDENEDTVEADKRSGSASADAHTLRTQGLQINLESSTTSATTPDTASTSVGTFNMTIEVTAIGDTMYVPETIVRGTSASTTGLTYKTQSGTSDYTAGVVTESFSYVSGATRDGNFIRIDEGQTATFEAVVTLDPGAAGQYRVVIVAAGFNDSGATPDSSVAATPESDYRTGAQYIAH